MPAICKADLPLDSFGRRYHHGGPGPQGLKYDIHVGTRLKIYWPKMREFYPGTITAVNPKGMYIFLYDDGEAAKVKLGTLVWDFEEPIVERRLKSHKITTDQVGKTSGQSSSKRVGGASKAEAADSGNKVDGDGDQMRQPSGYVAEVMQFSYKEDFGMDNRKNNTDAPQKITVECGGLSKKRTKSTVDDSMHFRTTAAGGFLPANNPPGHGGALRRVRKPSPLVRDLLGGDMVGGCGLERFALTAANLLAPPKAAETAEGALIMPGEAEQLQGQQRRRSQQSPTNKLRAPNSAPLFSPPIRTLGPRMELEERSSPTSSDQTVRESEEPKPSKLAMPPAGVEDETQELPISDLMVEVSQTSSPWSDNMYVALVQESSQSGADEAQYHESQQQCDHLDLEVSSDAKHEVKEGENVGREKEKGRELLSDPNMEANTKEKTGSPSTGCKLNAAEERRGGASTNRDVHHKKPYNRRLQVPDMEGARGVRRLADVYEATGGWLPGFARKKKGAGHGPYKRKRSSPARVEALAELPLSSDEGPGVTVGIWRLPDLNVPSKSHMLKAPAAMMGDRSELRRATGCCDEEKTGGKVMGVTTIDLADGCKTFEEESEEVLAWTLLQLRGHHTGSLAGAVVVSDGDGVGAELELTRRQIGSGDGPTVSGTLGWQFCRGLAQAATGGESKLVSEDCGRRSGGSYTKGLPVEATAAWRVEDQGRFPEPHSQRSRPVSDHLRDMPSGKASQGGMLTTHRSRNRGGSSQDAHGGLAGCVPTEQSLGTKVVSIENGCGSGAERVENAKAKPVDDRIPTVRGSMVEPRSACTGGGFSDGMFLESIGEGQAHIDRSLRAKICIGNGSGPLEDAVVALNLRAEELLVEGDCRSSSASLTTEALPTYSSPSPRDSFDAEGAVRARHAVRRGEIEETRELFGQSSLGQMGREVRVSAAGAVPERGSAPSGVLCHQSIKPASGQAMAMQTGGTQYHELWLSSKEREEIFLKRLQKDSRKRAAALQQVGLSNQIEGTGGVSGEDGNHSRGDCRIWEGRM